ncbi:ROK family transcriptional regulator [Deinococcus roseus]|uniref:Sugar kinase n=1 Tax=Deinococcus roseus TaxID=392414 RepID=A0ABQ2DA68_9DEIO|nr:ROK family transcriptional regulator [Deinococcus roseus]GGJ51375.1 sugar kinase [Deinococcus roseus]
MGRPAALRAINRAQILKRILREGALSRSELAERTEISSVTVTYIVNDLLEEGILSEMGRTEGSSGRPAQKVDLNPRGGSIVGMDLQRNRVLYGVTNARRDAVVHQVQEVSSASEVTGAMLEVLENLVTAPPESGPVRHLCLAVPAPVNAAGEMGSPNSLPELDLPAIAAFCAKHSMDLRVDNDANLGARAEHHLGAVKDEQHFAFLLERPTGIGLGLYLDGQPYRGQRGLAGELALVRWPSNKKAIPIEELTGNAQETALAYMVAGLALTLDLSAVVVHQDLAPEPGKLMEKLQGLVTPDLRIVHSSLGQNSVVQGALVQGAELFQERLLALPEF